MGSKDKSKIKLFYNVCKVLPLRGYTAFGLYNCIHVTTLMSRQTCNHFCFLKNDSKLFKKQMCKKILIKLNIQKLITGHCAYCTYIANP